MIRLRLMVLASMSCVAIASCSAEHREDSDVKIVGGQAVTDEAKWPTAVAIFGNGSLCTGTLVHPRLVITAAHCMDSNPDPKLLRVAVGDRIEGAAVRGVIKTNINPNYQDNAVTDFAYVLLDKPFDNVKLVQVATDPQELKILQKPGATATLVGFGTTESGAIGTKFETTTVVGQNQGGALFIGGGGKDTCQGDSGGPAFGQLPNGEFRVFGITSRGSGCGGGGVYARMNDGLCFIQKDSGITIPGSKLVCDGVQNIPLSGGSTDNGTLLAQPLHMGLGAEDANAPDTFNFAVSAEKATVKVDLCIGSTASCLASRKQDMAFSSLTHDGAGLNFFQSNGKAKIGDRALVTLLGYDASGKLIQATGMQFKLLTP